MTANDVFWMIALLVGLIVFLSIGRVRPVLAVALVRWEHLLFRGVPAPREVEELLDAVVTDLARVAREDGVDPRETWLWRRDGWGELRPVRAWTESIGVCRARLASVASLLDQWNACLADLRVSPAAAGPAPLEPGQLHTAALRRIALAEHLRRALPGGGRRATWLHVASLSRAVRVLMRELDALPRHDVAAWPARVRVVAADLRVLARDVVATHAALLVPFQAFCADLARLRTEDAPY